ncbi:MAG: hypothetical protein AB8B87_12565 [Granulosicoccus sp.]
MRSNVSACFYAGFVLLMSSVVSAQDSGASADEPDTSQRDGTIERQPIPDYERLGVMRRSIVIVDDAQRAASERFGSFMGQVDGFFSNAGSNADAVSNGSWARIRIDGVRANDEDFELDPSLKLRAVLPRTERKLKLLISTEDDDALEPGEVQSQSSQGNQNVSLALRFIRTARANSDVNIDIGVRQRDGAVQFFGRLNSRYTLDLGRKWVAKAANSYYYYSKSGFENRLSFDFRRLLYAKDNLFFRTYTDFSWEKGQKGSIISHTTGLYWQVSDRRSVALEGLASYHTSINTGISDRFRGHEFRIRWRHNVWRPWFFYEIWPSVSWPSSTGYRQANGFLLRVEVMIGQGG